MPRHRLALGPFPHERYDMKVFVSIGSGRSPSQSKAYEAILGALRAAELEPREMAAHEWSKTKRLGAVADIMNECQAVVVVATQRYKFTSGTEVVASGPERQLRDVCQPTVWNQIEGAIAVAKGLPVFVIAEEGLRVDGLLSDDDEDWTVHWAPLSAGEFSTEELRVALEGWRAQVTAAQPAEAFA